MTGDARSGFVWHVESMSAAERCSGSGGVVRASASQACGVRPVHRRKDRWNAAGSKLQKERDVADAQAAILKQCLRENPAHLIKNVAIGRAPSSARRRSRSAG